MIGWTILILWLGIAFVVLSKAEQEFEIVSSQEKSLLIIVAIIWPLFLVIYLLCSVTRYLATKIKLLLQSKS